jgi:hypothetical protein
MARLVIGEDEFRVKLKVLQSVYFDADIIQRSHTPYCLDKLGLWELVEGARQHVYLDPTLIRTRKVACFARLVTGLFTSKPSAGSAHHRLPASVSA